MEFLRAYIEEKIEINDEEWHKLSSQKVKPPSPTHHRLSLFSLLCMLLKIS